MPGLQLKEKRSDRSPLLVDCPGCPKCEHNGGYLIHLSAGRPTKSHEYVFLLTKSERYYYDAEAIREPMAEEARIRREYEKGMVSRLPATRRDPSQQSGNKGLDANFGARHKYLERGGRNARSVWTLSTTPFAGSHFATMPPALVEKCIKAGCPKGGIVCDPFSGAGTTPLVADRLGRHGIGLDLNRDYCVLARDRIHRETPLFSNGVHPYPKEIHP